MKLASLFIPRPSEFSFDTMNLVLTHYQKSNRTTSFKPLFKISILLKPVTSFFRRNLISRKALQERLKNANFLSASIKFQQSSFLNPITTTEKCFRTSPQRVSRGLLDVFQRIPSMCFQGYMQRVPRVSATYFHESVEMVRTSSRGIRSGVVIVNAFGSMLREVSR